MNKWEVIYHTKDGRDESSEGRSQLVPNTGYTGEIVIHKIKKGFVPETGVGYAKVQHKPTKLTVYIVAMREFKYSMKILDRYEDSQPGMAQTSKTGNRSPTTTGT